VLLTTVRLAELKMPPPAISAELLENVLLVTLRVPLRL
jgi:hypothetical protein